MTNTTQEQDKQKEPLLMRGRNGWFRFASFRVLTTFGPGDPISVELFSRRFGGMPPVILTGEREDVRALLTSLIEAVDRTPSKAAQLGKLQELRSAQS